jgi:hypothetical protein
LIDAQDKRTQGDYSIDDNSLSKQEIETLIEQSKLFIDLAEKSLLFLAFFNLSLS